MILRVLCVVLGCTPVMADGVGREIDGFIQKSTHGGFWGVVFVAKGEDVLLSKGYGFSDYGTRPNDADTLFEIASLSKNFTAAAIYRLEMDGKIDVDDSIATVFENVPEGKKAVTIRHLLSHTAGVSASAGVPYDSSITRDDYVAQALAKPWAPEPGTRFKYSNVGYALLAALVEVASGQSFESYSKEVLFRPAGMKDTGFINDPELDSARAAVRLSQRVAPDSTAAKWHWGWGYRGMGGVVTTARDLWRWEKALRRHAVLSQEATNRMFEVKLGGYASGWYVGSGPVGQAKVHHSGGVAGFRAQLVRYPGEGGFIVILTNDKTALQRLTPGIESRLMPGAMVQVMISVGSRDLGENKVIRLAGSAAWTVERRADGVALELREAKDQEPLTTVHLPMERARSAARQLETFLTARKRQGRSADGDDMDGTIALRPYGGDDRVELAEGIRFRVQDRYNEGQPSEIDRVTLVVDHQARRFWPVLTRLSDSAARRLARDLEAALRED